MKSEREGTSRFHAASIGRRARITAAGLLLAAPLASCVIPFDNDSGELNMAIEQIDNAMYALRDENALLQAQIDSLARAVRKTDSLLRLVANLTGNPIVDTPSFVLPRN
jgi:hypothetical protein